MELNCLVIQRDERGALELCSALAEQGVPAEWVDGTATALAALRHSRVQALLLNADDCGHDFLATVRLLVGASPAPLLVLSAARDEVNEILALELGAADFFRKPVSPRLVLAKLRRLSREAPQPAAAAERLLELGPLTLDLRGRMAAVRGALVPLTAREFELLVVLATRRNELVTRETIARLLDGATSAGSRSVDVAIARLRRKLAVNGARAVRIGTAYGRGYFLAVDETPPDATHERDRDALLIA